MSDNIFDGLADLLSSSGPVNWRLAREVAESVAGPAEPIDPWIEEEYRELAATACRQIDAASPLDPMAGGTEVEVTDRRGWAAGNVESFAPLAEPMATKLGEGTTDFGLGLQSLQPALVGMQFGSLAGLMSHRVLGQFDVGLPAAARPVIALVAPNVEAFAAEEGVDVRQARLWATLHEVSHHAEHSLPWITDYLSSQIRGFVDGLEVDVESMRRHIEALGDPREMERMVDDPKGFGGPLAVGEGGQEALGRLWAAAAVMYGYGEHLVERTALDLLPEAGRIREAALRSRPAASSGERALQRMLGLVEDEEAYRAGWSFCAEVARRWGEAELDRMWEDSEMLPQRRELEDPVGWAARVLL